MSTLNQRIAKRLAAATLTSAILFLAIAQPATAHGGGHRPAVADHYLGSINYRSYKNRRYDRLNRGLNSHRYLFPRWLQRDREFQRWFLRNEYRFFRGASWERVYDLYRFERRHWRKAPRRFRGKVYVTPDYLYRNRRW